MLGMSLLSFLILTLIGAVVAVAYCRFVRCRSLEGNDALLRKLIVDWLGHRWAHPFWGTGSGRSRTSRRHRIHPLEFLDVEDACRTGKQAAGCGGREEGGIPSWQTDSNGLASGYGVNSANVQGIPTICRVHALEGSAGLLSALSALLPVVSSRMAA
jgi:hypothetical protein